MAPFYLWCVQILVFLDGGTRIVLFVGEKKRRPVADLGDSPVHSERSRMNSKSAGRGAKLDANDLPARSILPTTYACLKG